VFETIESHFKARMIRRMQRTSDAGEGVAGAGEANHQEAGQLPALAEEDGERATPPADEAIPPMAGKNGMMRSRRMSVRGSGTHVVYNSGPIPDLLPPGEGSGKSRLL